MTLLHKYYCQYDTVTPNKQKRPSRKIHQLTVWKVFDFLKWTREAKRIIQIHLIKLNIYNKKRVKFTTLSSSSSPINKYKNDPSPSTILLVLSTKSKIENHIDNNSFKKMMSRNSTEKYVPTTITIRHNNSYNPTTINSKFVLSAQYKKNNKINEQNNTDIIYSSTIPDISFVLID